MFGIKGRCEILQRIYGFPQGGVKARLGLAVKFSREFQKEAQAKMLRDGNCESAGQGGKGYEIEVYVGMARDQQEINR